MSAGVQIAADRAPDCLVRRQVAEMHCNLIATRTELLDLRDQLFIISADDRQDDIIALTQSKVKSIF